MNHTQPKSIRTRRHLSSPACGFSIWHWIGDLLPNSGRKFGLPIGGATSLVRETIMQFTFVLSAPIKPHTRSTDSYSSLTALFVQFAADCMSPQPLCMLYPSELISIMIPLHETCSAVAYLYNAHGKSREASRVGSEYKVPSGLPLGDRSLQITREVLSSLWARSW